MPYLKDGAQLCLKFHDLDWKNSTFSGCVDLIGYLLDVKVGVIRIGCFNLTNRSYSFKLESKISIVSLSNTNVTKSKNSSLIDTFDISKSDEIKPIYNIMNNIFKNVRFKYFEKSNYENKNKTL